MSVTQRIAFLHARSSLLRAARDFFYARGINEVDVPCLSRHASVDLYIDLIPAQYAQTQSCYLHSSPEYGMKRLLAEGIGDIFQLSHVFRDGESGHKHNPEFMLAEWYRKGFSLDQMIDETFDFISLFLEGLPREKISYRQAFLQFAGIDYLAETPQSLYHILQQNGISSHLNPDIDSKDDFLNLLLAVQIEPQLGKGKWTALVDYPASQCALAQKRIVDDEEVASRFEIYHEGLELANGYHELLDSEEQLKRLEEANIARKRIGKSILPIDMLFIGALKEGMPDCCGVAVGFDRLMMLRCSAPCLSQVMPFTWENS